MRRFCVLIPLILSFCFIVGCPYESVADVAASSEAAASESAFLESHAVEGHDFTTPANCLSQARCRICGEKGDFGPHDFVGGDCQTPSVCSLCNAEGPLGDHVFIGGDCQHPALCSICGAEGPLGDHVFSTPTCTDPGVCEICGAETPATGHKMVPATCTEPRHCKVCGYSDGEAKGHASFGYCSVCQSMGDTHASGSGDGVLSNICLPKKGLYMLHITNKGSHNFIVNLYDDASSPSLLVNEIGNYDGYSLMWDDGPFVLEISSSGDWTVDVLAVEQSSETSFSGHGDGVSPIISCRTGTWRITNVGEHNFYVYTYTTDGSNLIINEIGDYSGEKYIQVPAGSSLLFEVHSSGDWTLEKVD